MMTKNIRFAAVFVLAGALLAFVQCKQPEPEADTNAPPTVTIASHVDGQMVDGSITVAGTATDDAGLSKIDITFSQAAQGADPEWSYTAQAVGTTAWSIDLNTTGAPAGVPVRDGNLFVKAKATDSGGYTAYGFVTLIIDNAGPTVSIISPQDGQKLSGAFSIVGLGTKLDSAELSIDGSAYTAVTGNYTWYKIWDTTAGAPGDHTISVRPVRGGVPGDAETVTVTVDQTVPSVAFTAPAIGAYIKGNPYSITGTATDNIGVARVEVSTNGGLNYSQAGGTTSWSRDLDTTALPDGARVLYARVIDVTGLFGLASIPVTIDNNAPTMSVTSHTDGTLVSGIVHLAGTSNDTVGVQKVEVQFGSLPTQLAEGTTAWNYDFNSASLSNGTYDVTVTVTDFAGNSSSSVVQLIADQSFPQVDTINISNGNYLKGVKSLSGTVSDGDGLADILKVEVKVGSGSYAAATYTSGAAPWSYDLDTASYPPDGARTVTVKVTDQVGGYSTLTRNVVFDNTLPSVAISSPANGGQVAGTVLVVGTVSDAGSGIGSMSLSVDGTPIGVPTRNGNYWYYSWNTAVPLLPLADYVVAVTAIDGALNSNTSTITVTKTNNLPSISIDSPINGAFVRGAALALSGTAFSDPGVSKVDIQVDSETPVTATGTISWMHSINTTELSEGVHVIYATVTDLAALTTTTQVTVTVDNTEPSISIINPTSANVGANALHGTILIGGTASDTNLSLVETDIDGGGYTAATGTTTWERSWDTATVTGVARNGVIVSARARDLAGNENTVTATVDVRPYVSSLSKYSSFRGDTVGVYGDNLVTGTPFTFKAGAGTVNGTLNWVALSSRFEVTVPATATSGNVHANTNSIASNDVYLNIWGIDTVGTSSNGQYPSLVLDGSDNIYLAFGRGGNSKTLKFAKYNGTLWTTLAADLDTLTGATHVSVAIGGSTAGSNVYIAYYNGDNTIRQLRLVKSATGGASFGAPLNIASLGLYSSVEAYYNAGALSDYVYIAYYDSVNQNLVLATSTNSGASFSQQTIDSTGDVGKHASLDLDSNHNPRIAYYDATNRALKLAYWDADLLVWRIRVVDPNTSGEFAGLAVGSDNGVHIGYYDGNDGDEEYATAAGPASPFTHESVDTDGITGWYGSLALDSFDDPHVAYYDYSLQALRYASWTAGTWDTLTVPESGTVGLTPTTIGIDSAGVQRIGYVGNGDVKVARYLP